MSAVKYPDATASGHGKSSICAVSLDYYLIPGTRKYLVVALDKLRMTAYCLRMPPVPTATPDRVKIREMIRERGTVAAFARKLGRHPQSLFDLANTSRQMDVSVTFLRQIARELGVKVSDISDWTGDDDSESDAEMKVPA